MTIATVLLFITVCLYAKNKENVSYVNVDGKTYFGNEIRSGIFKTKIVSTDGTVLKFANRKVDAIMHENKLFERLPVIANRNDIVGMAMMEYITSRDGLRLYRYTCYNQDCDFARGIVSDTYAEDYYFVFKDGKFYLRIDSSNAASALSFFGIQLIS